MPRDGDPRVMVRMSPEGYAAVKAAADEAGVSVGGLVRECAERYAAEVAREVGAGGLRIRRSTAKPGGPRPVRVDTVEQAHRWALARQAKLNKAKGL